MKQLLFGLFLALCALPHYINAGKEIISKNTPIENLIIKKQLVDQRIKVKKFKQKKVKPVSPGKTIEECLEAWKDGYFDDYKKN